MAKNKTVILIILLVTMLLLVGGTLYWNYRTSPKYSLEQISKSFLEHDLTTFQKYVDIDGTINNLFDQQMDLTTKDNKDELGLAEDFAKGISTLMRPQMIELLKRQTKTLIEDGSFDGSDTIILNDNPFTLAAVWNKGGNMNNILGIEEIKIDGKVSIITLKSYQARFDTTLLVNIKMRNKGNYWQLSEISGFSKFAISLEKLEKERVDKINAPIYEQIRKSITISDVKLKTISSYWGLDDKIKVTMDVKNIGHNTISGYFLLVGFSNDTKIITEDKIEIKHSEGLLKPYEVETWTWTTDDTFDKSDDEEFGFNTETQYVRFSDGTELKIIKKWDE